MTRRASTITWLVLVCGLCALAQAVRADAPSAARPPIPPGLPEYDIRFRLDVDASSVQASERVVFTNRSTKSTSELVFHVYPRYQVRDAEKVVLAKTLEMLRLSPDEALDAVGRRMSVLSVRGNDGPLEHSFDVDDDTILVVALPAPLAPGETAAVTIEFTLDLPDKWGRWGRHNDVTYLLNWYPVLAVHGDAGWSKTPFVPWHQPWHQEAGLYRVRADLPRDEVVASSGRITDRAVEGERQVLTIEARPARDFALVCSKRFQVWEKMAGTTPVRVVAFPEHHTMAQVALEAACEAIPVYERWFGPYPGGEFEIAASYFGWNGNECSDLVLLDDRVFRLPSAGARYVDHLVSHETCHQWWWNCVGSDGYAETFMDEGLVTCFTALRLNDKYGYNSPLITWPRGLSWLPTIGREDMRLAGYYGWRAKGGSGPVVQDLGDMKNLNALFSLAYDRGGKVVEMIRNRIGDARFEEFFRHIYSTYAWKILRFEDLKRELVSFDPAGNWAEFLDAWLTRHETTDWAIERVDLGAAESGSTIRPVTIELKQLGSMHEPTIVLCRSGDEEIRVPVWPDRPKYEVSGASVERDGDRYIVRVHAPAAPTQVLVDPDHALLDARPDNNRWKPEVNWRLSPMVTPLDEASAFQSIDKVSIVAGPFIDQYARGGLRAAAQRANRWQVSGWAGTEPALREAIFGGQAALLNTPWENWMTGVFYEEGLFNFHNDRRHSGGRAFMRYRLLESSSFIVDDPGFIELYYGIRNEFWAGDDGRPVGDFLAALGGRYRLSTLFPYWDPVDGRLIDATVEYGSTAYGSAFDYVRMTGEWGIVRPFPAGFGWMSRSRVALRAYGGFGFPDNEPLFRLGGGRRLRALDLSQFIGSSVWLTTIEWRMPIWREIDQDVADHVLCFKNLFGTLFYDVGQSYFHGHWYPVVHGVGVGIRLDVALFSFLERATLRLDIAQPVSLGPRGPVLWFGINQVF